MSGKLMGELYNVELSKPLRDVALALANFADDDGYGIFPSVGRVAWMLGQDRRYLQRRIRKLQELGVLVEVQPATARQAAEYRMELAALDRKPPYEPVHRHRSRCGSEFSLSAWIHALDPTDVGTHRLTRAPALSIGDQEGDRWIEGLIGLAQRAGERAQAAPPGRERWAQARAERQAKREQRAQRRQKAAA